MQFRLFVYGTLKQGQRNFPHYCGGVLAVQPACVLGRLYDLPYGYPMLEIPPQHVLAVGTGDYEHDAALAARLAGSTLSPPAPVTGDWEMIFGEVQTFDDPAARLPRLDVLENFRPGGESLYHRVVVRLQSPHELVWTYVAADGRLPAGAVRTGPRWPAKA